MKAILDWFWSTVFADGWWRRHPSEWDKIKKNYDKVTQTVVRYDLIQWGYNRFWGKSIRHVKCKICGNEWYTTCRKDLCNSLNCWVKYYGRKH